MNHVVAPQGMESLEVSAVVTRCGCMEWMKAKPHWHGRHGTPCPHPRAHEDHGVIVRWNRNPLRQALNVLRRVFTGKV